MEKKIWITEGEFIRGKDGARYLTNIEKEKQKLYYMYEFSDQLSIIDKNVNSYPSIFNLVTTGILTEDEAWRALRRK